MSALLPFLFGALCALFAVPGFLFVRLNRVEGAGSSPPRRDHWWTGTWGQYIRNRGAANVVVVFGGAFLLLRQGPFAGEEFDLPALLGFTLAQGLFWALILSFPPPVREDRSELSRRASARAKRRSTKPPLWLSLGLGLTLLGTLLLFPGGLPPEWSFRFGVVLLTPLQLLLGFNCISSMIRTPLASGMRWGFLLAFLSPTCVSLAAS